MSGTIILLCIAVYFGFLLLIAWVTSRNATQSSYFIGNKASPWFAVAFGLIGDSLSGVTFISVPGTVAAQKFAYLQIVLGYILGYVVIAEVLLPVYYKLNLTSIYSYLLGRFGLWSQRTGSFFFILSRTVGAAFRLFLAASVLQVFVFSKWNIPFALTVLTIIVLILVYTYKGGIKTLVWTDTFQSTFLLLGLIFSIVAIGRELNWGPGEMLQQVANSPYSQIFFWDWQAPTYFWKQFIGGAFIAIVMTGLDQNMMQKNLSCPSLREAKKNIYSFTGVMVFVNILFVSLGALLYLYSSTKGIAIPQKTDQLFPNLALNHLGTFSAIVFIFGLTAATFSSADSVLTTLTTSFYIDILGLDRNESMPESKKNLIRHGLHLGFAGVLLLLIVGFWALNNEAVITQIFVAASYTYGPLLGLFAFGLLTKRTIVDGAVPLLGIAAPLVAWFISFNSVKWLGGYKFGPELLVLNGALTFAGLLCVSRPATVGGKLSPV